MNCGNCGSMMVEGSARCAQCGWMMAPPPPPPGPSPVDQVITDTAQLARDLIRTTGKVGRDVAHKIGPLAHDVGEKVKPVAHDVVEKAKPMMRDVARDVKQFGAHAGTKAREVTDRVRRRRGGSR